MLRKLLFGVFAVVLAGALEAALLSSVTSWGFLTAKQADSVFCSYFIKWERIDVADAGLAFMSARQHKVGGE